MTDRSRRWAIGACVGAPLIAAAALSGRARTALVGARGFTDSAAAPGGFPKTLRGPSGDERTLAGPKEAWSVHEGRVKTQNAKLRSIAIDEADVALGAGSLAQISFKGSAKSGDDKGATGRPVALLVHFLMGRAIG